MFGVLTPQILEREAFSFFKKLFVVDSLGHPQVLSSSRMPSLSSEASVKSEVHEGI